MERLRSRSNLLIGLLITFAVSVATVLLKGLEDGNFGDTPDYFAAASAILNQEIYPRESSLPFFRPPGYPTLIAFTWLVFGEGDFVGLKLLNCLVHLGSTFLVYSLARKWLSDSKSILAAVVFGLNPFSLHQLTQVSTETVTCFLMLATITLLTKKSGSSRLLFLVITFNLLIFTRPEYSVVVASLLVFASFNRTQVRVSLKDFITIVVSVAIMIGLWGNANAKAVGSFIPFTDAANYHLWLGTLDLVGKNYSIARVGEEDFAGNQNELLNSEIAKNISKWGQNYTQASIAEKSELWWGAYIERLEEMGFKSYLSLLVFKAIMFWRPFLNPPSYGTAISLLSALFLIPLTFSFVVGAWKFWRVQVAREQISMVLITLIIITWVHMLQLPDLRYKIPIFLPYSSIMFIALIDNRSSGLWLRKK